MVMTEPITRAIDKKDKRINTSSICDRRLKRGRESTSGHSLSSVDSVGHTVFFELFIDLESDSKRFIIINIYPVKNVVSFTTSQK